MALDNHNDPNYSVYQMVLNRLPFVLDNVGNKTVLSQLTLEVMWEVEKCFKIAETPLPADPLRVGDENLYSVFQRSIIADLVCVYTLANAGAAATTGTSNITTNSTANASFLQTAKAGSVEVAWDQFNVATGATLAMNGTNLFNMFKKQAIKKAATIGCIIDISDDSTLQLQLINQSYLTPFVVINDCHSCGS